MFVCVCRNIKSCQKANKTKGFGAFLNNNDTVAVCRVLVPVSPLCLNRADEICSFALFFIAFRCYCYLKGIGAENVKKAKKSR